MPMLVMTVMAIMFSIRVSKEKKKSFVFMSKLQTFCAEFEKMFIMLLLLRFSIFSVEECKRTRCKGVGRTIRHI